MRYIVHRLWGRMHHLRGHGRHLTGRSAATVDPVRPLALGAWVHHPKAVVGSPYPRRDVESAERVKFALTDFTRCQHFDAGIVAGSSLKAQ